MDFHGRAAHIKLLCICLLCLVIYVYLYANASLKTVQIVQTINETLEDFREWKNTIGKMVYKVKSGDEEPIKNQMTTGLSRRHCGNASLCENKTDVVQNTARKVGLSEPIITLFTSWITKPEKYECHNLTLFNWNLFKRYVRPILFINEEKVKEEAIKKGWTVLPVRVTGTSLKVPVLRYMYLDAMKVSNTTFYAYANGDILFTDTLLNTLRELYKSNIINLTDPFLIVGQRTNVQSVTKDEIKTFGSLTEAAKKRGKLFTSWGEDYFITGRNYPWDKVADVVIGRVAYDNWMVWNTKRLGYPTIDATLTLLAVHDTTKSGNYEGHSKPEGGYNNNILAKMHKRIKYGAGITTCADYFSNFSVDGKIQFTKRKLKGGCLP